MNARAALSWLPAAQREALKAAARKFKYRAVKAALSYSADDLERVLRTLGVADGDAIIMQSAFRAGNGFSGEAPHVIDCILDLIGPRGHLLMVSMPYEDSARQYLSEGKVFDVRRTPSKMGLLSESFRRRQGVLRESAASSSRVRSSR